VKSDPKADFNSGWDLMVVIAGTEFCTMDSMGVGGVLSKKSGDAVRLHWSKN